MKLVSFAADGGHRGATEFEPGLRAEATDRAGPGDGNGNRLKSNFPLHLPASDWYKWKPSINPNRDLFRILAVTENVQPQEVSKFEMLVQSVTDYAIYMLDPDGIVTSWNAGAERFKGYTPDEIIGQHFSRFYTDTDRASGLPQRALATAAQEGRFEAEGWRIRKDGTRFWADVVLDRIQHPDGTLAGFAKITRDLTHRRAAQEELRRSEERFRLLVQSVTDYAIYMLDLDGHVTSWNAGAERFKGYRADEIMGEHFSRFYPPEDREAGVPERALATAREMGRFEAEGWRHRKDGSRF